VRAAFTHTNLKSAKRQPSHLCLLVLLRPACKKAARKMLVKLTPVGDISGSARSLGHRCC